MLLLVPLILSQHVRLNEKWLSRDRDKHLLEGKKFCIEKKTNLLGSVDPHEGMDLRLWSLSWVSQISWELSALPHLLCGFQHGRNIINAQSAPQWKKEWTSDKFKRVMSLPCNKRVFITAWAPCATSELAVNALFCGIHLIKVWAPCGGTVYASWEHVRLRTSALIARRWQYSQNREVEFFEIHGKEISIEVFDLTS